MLKKTGQLLRAAPDIPTLHQLLAKCFQQPGEKLQVSWRSSENQLFILDVIYSLKDRRPNWQLMSDKSGRRVIIADYAGHDILLVYKQITTAANNALDARASDDSNRLTKTRDARAAATNWLESKGDNPIDSIDNVDQGKAQAAPSANAGFWSDDQLQDDRQSGGSIAAAIDESPWNTASSTGGGSTGQQYSNQNTSNQMGGAAQPAPHPSTMQPSSWGQSSSFSTGLPFNWAATATAASAAQAKAKESSQNTGQKSPGQTGQNITPSQAQANQNPSQTQANQNPAQTQNNAARALPPAQSFSAQPTSPPAQASPAQVPQAQVPSAQVPQAQALPPQAAFPPPAPVKVTGPAPQSSAPKPLPSQTIPPKGQTPAGSGTRDRGVVHPDKAPSGPGKSSERDEKSAATKKNISAEKAATAAKQSGSSPDLGKFALPTSGSLTDITVPKLLKQLKTAQVTGRLDFADEPLKAMVFLEDGKPIEAWLGELKGDSALLEILLWTSGNYSLNIGATATNRNVRSSPEVLVEHNKNIASLLDELSAEGLTATSTFSPSNALLSSDDFNRLATPQAPMELEKLARLYVKLDGKKTMAELNELQVLPRPALVQAIHHLYYNNIIDIVDPTERRKELVVTPKEVNNAAIQSVMTSLRRIDTGLFIYPAFLYFLQEEFFRIYRAKSSMSVIIFEMRELSASGGLVRRLPLSVDAIADATMRISRCKRHTDLAAHYEEHDFAILLPSTGSGGTKVFANKIIKALTDTPLAGTEGKKLSFSFGTASMPEDFRELSMLLAAAELAMNFARQKGKALVLFKEIEL